jgi:hypothetical protein
LVVVRVGFIGRTKKRAAPVVKRREERTVVAVTE